MYHTHSYKPPFLSFWRAPLSQAPNHRFAPPLFPHCPYSCLAEATHCRPNIRGHSSKQTLSEIWPTLCIVLLVINKIFIMTVKRREKGWFQMIFQKLNVDMWQGEAIGLSNSGICWRKLKRSFFVFAGDCTIKIGEFLKHSFWLAIWVNTGIDESRGRR